MNEMAFVQACRSSIALVRFVMGDGLRAAVLSIVGEAHAAAATFALTNVTHATNTEAEVRLAIGHLQAAHVAQRLIWDEFYSSPLGNLNRYYSSELAAETDQKICSLMAGCYLALNERVLAARALQLATEARAAVYVNEGMIGLKAGVGMLASVLDPRETMLAVKKVWGKESVAHETVYQAVKAAVQNWPV